VSDFLGGFLRKVKNAIRSINAKMISSSQFFDRDWYLKQYPDVRRSGLDPFDHYRRFGRREGRIPGPHLSGCDPKAMRLSARVDADCEFLEKITAAATGQSLSHTEKWLTRSRPPDASPARAVLEERENRAHAALAGDTAAAMNVVIVNHGPYDSNSAVHITGFGNALAALGHRVVVSATGITTDAGDFGMPRFCCIPHESVRDTPGTVAKYFTGAGTGAPDLVHCWTPRQVVRAVTQAVVERYGCPYIVHFEDNERAIADANESYGKRRKGGGAKTPPAAEPDTAADAFVRGAAGATIIVEALKRVLPEGLPCHLLEPGVDGDLFAPGMEAAQRERLCRTLAVPSDAWITVYPGNIHAANYEDMFSLYAAIHAVNARGHKVHLIRTGVDSVGSIERRFLELTDRYVTNLGFVRRNWLIDLFKLADFFVQPGGPDNFNSQRLPSKLPELLAMGRPVVLPKTNIGLLMHDRINALLMQRGDAAEITECLETLLSDPVLADRMGQAGRRFAIEHFNWERSTKHLESFYRRILGR
jgi:glycosyltransferase involved in cell wall biosynthesis